MISGRGILEVDFWMQWFNYILIWPDFNKIRILYWKYSDQWKHKGKVPMLKLEDIGIPDDYYLSKVHKFCKVPQIVKNIIILANFLRLTIIKYIEFGHNFYSTLI